MGWGVGWGFIISIYLSIHSSITNPPPSPPRCTEVYDFACMHNRGRKAFNKIFTHQGYKDHLHTTFTAAILSFVLKKHHYFFKHVLVAKYVFLWFTRINRRRSALGG